MPVAVPDSIELSVCSELFGENVCNIFQFVVNSVNGIVTLFEFLETYRDLILPVQSALQSSALEVVELKSVNLTNELDFATLGVSNFGDILTASVSSAVAAAIKLNVDTRETRPGGKRLAGIPVADVSTNIYTPNAVDMDNYLSALSTAIIVSGALPGASATFIPQIIGRDPITHKYDLSRRQPISTATVRNTVTTQVSRGAGRGV